MKNDRMTIKLPEDVRRMIEHYARLLGMPEATFAAQLLAKAMPHAPGLMKLTPPVVANQGVR